jgi:hypothetical protein
MVSSIVVDIKTAVANATEFAKESLGLQRTTGLRLEEIEWSSVEDTPVWLVTLSVADSSMMSIFKGAGQVYGADAGREYKTFTVAKGSGEVLSMKIRLLAVPD